MLRLTLATTLALTALAGAARGEGRAESDYETTFTIDGSEDGRVAPGQASELRFRYLDKRTGELVHHFHVMHEKPMHLIVVSSDLRHFAHIHPQLNHHRREFSIVVNQADRDPDNFDTVRSIEGPGTHYAFAEVMPHGEELMVNSRFVVPSTKPTPKTDPLTVDLPYGEAKVVRYFTADSQPGQEGDMYRVTFELEQFQWCSWFLPKFYMSIASWTGERYEPVRDFEEWLSMGGHAVLISETGEKLEDKTFYHLHAFLPMATPGEYTFPYHDHQKPLPDGTYKIWGQMKHRGRVLTLPFVFEYRNPEMPSSFAASRCYGASAFEGLERDVAGE